MYKLSSFFSSVNGKKWKERKNKDNRKKKSYKINGRKGKKSRKKKEFFFKKII